MIEGQRGSVDEKFIDMFKALSNSTRVKILQLLKQPEENFPPQVHKGKEFPGGYMLEIFEINSIWGSPLLLNIYHCYRIVVF